MRSATNQPLSILENLSNQKQMKILRIDSSARYQASISRQLADQLIAKLKEKQPDANVVVRDVAKGLPFVNEAIVVAINTPAEERTAEQTALLATSDELVQELSNADTLVISAPIYNFSVPATLTVPGGMAG